MPKPTAPTGWSDAFGLRRVISNGEAGDDGWPHKQRRVTNAGLVYHENDAEVGVMSNLPNTRQRWDADYPGPGVTGPAQDGPAVAALRSRPGKTS